MLDIFRNHFQESYEHIAPRGSVTISQKAWFLIGVICTIYWLFKRLVVLIGLNQEPEKPTQNHDDSKRDSVTIVVDEKEVPKTTTPSVTISKTPTVTFDNAIQAAVVVFLILFYYFLCDYVHFFPSTMRIYNRDLFLFLLLLLLIVNVVYTSSLRTDIDSDKLLNREQTEEWKGWMQVMFVWYHYFKAVETYNAVRIFIACYVWMTGFGNFSFFWVRKDYSFRRILNSLFRLNFLVVLTTVATNNQYMLYYICAMHTFWYLSVYLMMRPFNQYNENPRVMALKFVVYFVVVFIIFEIPGVLEFIFKPFTFFLNFKGSLHEWKFRSTLDHYATLLGMLCAYFHPTVEYYLKRLSRHPKEKLIIGALCMVLVGINCIWYKYVFQLDKYSYNKLHPYTFFLPLLTYIFVRNSTSFLRRWHCGLFTFLGKITLETYISQLHIYLQQDAKSILVYIPNYPLLNFLVNTFIYIKFSTYLFNSTITLNQYIFPNNVRKLWRNIGFIAMTVITSYAVSFLSNWL